MTTLEPSKDESSRPKYPGLIFHLNKGKPSGTENPEGYPETIFDGEKRDPSSRGEALRDLHLVSDVAADLESLSIG